MARVDGDTPCDFLTYLEWRLGKDEDDTARLLGEWLSSYEPVRRFSSEPREFARSPDRSTVT
jgi:hypothetical protein